MNELPPGLQALAQFKQFCLWKLIDGKKIPISPHTGAACDPHDPVNQLTADQVFVAADFFGARPGFVFTDNDPLFFIDIDNALQPDGQWSPIAKELCERFRGAAIEISQSGKGLHIFGYSTSTRAHSNKNAELHIEMYRRKRFVALTGRGLVGEVWTDLTIAQDGCAEQYFPPRPDVVGEAWTSEPVAEWMGPSDDEELLRRMLSARGSDAAFLKQRAKLVDLWEANEDTLGEFYPHADQPFDHSSADAALCSHLAFWTGKDCERMERLFSRSALTRDKWESRPDYRRVTIGYAVSLCTEVYKDPRVTPVIELTQIPPTLPGEPAAIAAAAGDQFLAPYQQQTYFEGCVYIRSRHEVFMPDGTLLSPPRFNATKGGYLFAVDGTSRTTTKKAFEAFTESQCNRFPQADGTCFRPELAPGQIIEHEGLTFVNTYVPAPVESVEGDVSPYLGLLAKLFRVEWDRGVMLAYMASLIQNPGVKFQWAPVVQGVQGNGKTFLVTALSKAIGERYSHFPDADQLGNRFNAWVQNNLFIGVEEICVPGKPQIVETLKRLITNSRVKIEAKGINEITGDNRANFFFCSNYQDGVTKIREDRRYCVFFTPQQSVDHLRRDGMDGHYFPNLYNWFNHKGGSANITYYLQHYAVPDELNPAYLCQRAPNTSSTSAAIVASRSIFEQEVSEAIEEGRYGYKDGWLSSCMIGDLVDEKLRNEKLPRNRRRVLLENLGYIQHPGLPDGRCNTPLAKEDGRKPTIYIHTSKVEAMALQGQAVVNAYMKAQG